MEMIRHSVTVRLHHTDAAGVLFYGRLFELVQEAFEEALRAGGLPLADLLRDGGFAAPGRARGGRLPPLRSASATCWTMRLSFEAGDRSLRVNAEIADGTGRPVGAARVVHAAVDPVTGAAVPLPDAVRALAR